MAGKAGEPRTLMMSYNLRMSFRRSVHQHGFTLVEAVISAGLIAMLGIGVFAFQQTIIRNSKILQNNLIAEQQVRKTLLSFVKEFRIASQSAGGAYAIEAAGTSSVTFFSNVDGDPDVERIRYFLSTSSLPTVYDAIKKGVTDPTGTTYSDVNERTSVIAQNIMNAPDTPLFAYYDANYDGSTTTAPLGVPVNIPQIRLIRLNIVMESADTRVPLGRTYMTQVSVRNLKDNL